MNRTIGNEMILASAGSGKTYALVNRYLRLLAMGEDPSRIIALTFTRKAAGEFLQKIFIRLTEASVSDVEAEKLSENIEIESRLPSFYKSILVSLVHEMANLQLGTIDSFFARIVGAFPYEMGLTRPHRIMDDFEQGMARTQAMEELLAVGDESRDNDILQLYKELTWGAEEKNVYALFEDSLKDFHALFLESRDLGKWGRLDLIFKSTPWWVGKDIEKETLARQIREALVELETTPSNHEKFEILLQRFVAWQPGQPLDNGTLLQRLLAARTELASGHAEIKFGRKEIIIEGDLALRLHQLLQTYVKQEIARRLMKTGSLGKLLAEFDACYQTSVRETGLLVFADLPMLLINALVSGGGGFSSDDIIYRMDGQADHWLIDEFQDTSRIQWKVLSSFVDEILQDPSGRRSFFHVGDIKQSIYGWRGGDCRLFSEIFERYGRGEDGIRKSNLYQSWRSAPPVLDCVNALFGKAINPLLCGREVAERWNAEWNEHEASPKTASLPGHAAWGLVDPDVSVEEGCIELIRKVDPLARGLSCAVLMRKNKDIISMTQALREAEIPASMEGRVFIALDNVVGTWIRAFLYSIARPDESFPRSYLEWHGFAYGETTHVNLVEDVSAALTNHGYAEAVRLILGFLENKLEITPFLVRRSDQLLEAATQFEGTNGKSLEGFLQFFESASVEESTLSSQVQVMTVHKAKGLDFDMVIVAGFGADPLVGSGNSSLHVERESDGEVEWILDLPNKVFLDAEPALSAAANEEQGRNLFEALCLLYVAMTRARQGLYCLAHPPSRNSSQTTWHQLFEAAFTAERESVTEGLIEWQVRFGDDAWHEQGTEPEALDVPPVLLKPVSGEFTRAGRALQRAASPSQESHSEEIFGKELRSTAGRQFGTRMHDLLALVDWVDVDNPREVAEVVAGFPDDLQERTRQLLESSHGREVFMKPRESCELWREKPYVLKQDRRIATGIIDRAIVFKDSRGSPSSVVIYDYKTDSLDPARSAEEQLLEKYRLQLQRYCEAVSVLTGLKPEKISARIVPV